MSIANRKTPLPDAEIEARQNTCQVRVSNYDTLICNVHLSITLMTSRLSSKLDRVLTVSIMSILFCFEQNLHSVEGFVSKGPREDL